MTEPKSMVVTDEAPAEAFIPEMDTNAASRKLTILPPPPPHRETRPVTNLGKVFGQFAELQQQIAEQVVALEESVHHQKQDLAAAMAQLPEVRDRVNWLIASFYEQSKKDESVRERLSRHDAILETLLQSVRAIQERQGTFHAAFDEMIGGLLRAKAAMEK
jgi:hypothetical protein